MGMIQPSPTKVQKKKKSEQLSSNDMTTDQFARKTGPMSMIPPKSASSVSKNKKMEQNRDTQNDKNKQVSSAGFNSAGAHTT